MANKSIKQSGEEYAACWEKGDPNYNLSISAYLAGAKAALAEMQAWRAIKVNQCIGPEAGRQTEMRQHYAQAYSCAMEKAQALIPKE